MAVGRSIFTGIGWIASERLAAALGTDAADPRAMATVLPLTHLLLPTDYVGVTVGSDGRGTTTISLDGRARGFEEGDPYSLPGLLAAGADEIIESLVHGVDPAATVRVASGPGDGRTWTVTAGSGAPATAPGPVRLVRLSTGAAVTLRRRVPVPNG
jgi:hypothetical protein